jgi:hypothetical protein
MALRLLPFRQYNESDVINIFALEAQSALTDTTSSNSGIGDAGVFVKVSTGNFNQDVVTYGSNSYLGKTDYPHVGSDMYPINPLTITAAGGSALKSVTDSVLGITLNQTAKADENGEKLLYNPTKREELQAVLPGQSVPVATKGIFTLSDSAFESAGVFASIYAVGTGIQLSAANAGLITGCPVNSSGSFGTVIGTGTRTSNAGITDQFAGDFLVVKFDTAAQG